MNVSHSNFMGVRGPLRAGDGCVAVPATTFSRSSIASNKGVLRATDLFAGAGGFSLGFEAAGFHVQSAIEIDEWACQTLAANHASTNVTKANLTEISDEELKTACSGSHVIVGGPPCQGYSVANSKAGDPTDPRNTLFMEFVRAVSLSAPNLVILENVPGLLKRKAKCGRFVIDLIAAELEQLGLVVSWTVLEAQSFGVPQLRPRLFVVGKRKGTWTFPKPTHGPVDTGQFSLLDSQLIPYVTTWEAISDLPQIRAREGAEQIAHEEPPQNDFQVLMRAGQTETFNHVAMRHSARLVDRFSHLQWGQSGMDAPEEHQARKRGDYTSISGKGFSQNNRRMHPDKPCHTIPASFYANFVHPFSHRNFTPREGARLQSFPDWYRFSGKPTVVSTKLLSREERTDELHLCQYNQIGNAVPPLLGYNLAIQVKRHLEKND